MGGQEINFLKVLFSTSAHFFLFESEDNLSEFKQPIKIGHLHLPIAPLKLGKTRHFNSEPSLDLELCLKRDQLLVAMILVVKSSPHIFITVNLSLLLLVWDTLWINTLTFAHVPKS